MPFKTIRLTTRGLLLCGTVLALSLAGCEKKAADTAKPTLTYTGQVKLYDEFGAALSDHSGVTIALYDDESVTTQTAADGTFSLTGAAPGKHRLQMSKKTFGFYYTNELEAQGSAYSLSQPVALGQQATVDYDYTCIANSVGKYMVVKGEIRYPNPAETRRRVHRVFLDAGAGYDGAIDLSVFKYSKLRRNTTATSFSDTIPFSKLTAAGIGRGVMVSVYGDNPAADSCIAPFNSTFPSIKTIRFAQRYPAVTGVGFINGLLFIWDK